jgi:hypothetical protein
MLLTMVSVIKMQECSSLSYANGTFLLTIEATTGVNSRPTFTTRDRGVFTTHVRVMFTT